MALLDTMKRIAKETGDVSVPASFLFGTVTSASPLTIRVDNRFDITGDSIVLMKEFRTGDYATHTHTTETHDHSVPQHETQDAGGEMHTHEAPEHSTIEGGDPAHIHAIKVFSTEDGGAGPHVHTVSVLQTGEASMTTIPASETYRGLEIGDMVVLLRNQGGQQFLVLGRM